MNGKRELTRSELVRLRRAKESTRQMERAVKEAARLAPAIARRAKPESVKKTRKFSQGNRRRFHIALPQVPRMNIRAIRIPRPRFGWRLFSFLLSAALGAALYYAFQLSELRVTEAKITGNQILTPAEVNSVLNVAGQPIFLLTPADLETRLRLNYPELISVRVEVALPNLVSVDMVERKPVIRWEQGGGYTWIAEDGVAFRPRGEMLGLIPVVAQSAPPVEGSAADPLSPTPFLSSEMVQALKGLSSHVPPNTPVLYDANLGFGWNDPRGWRVYFGTKSNDVELKMRVYESMVSSLTQRGIRPAFINVIYPSAPYYRMSQ